MRRCVRAGPVCPQRVHSANGSPPPTWPAERALGRGPALRPRSTTTRAAPRARAAAVPGPTPVAPAGGRPGPGPAAGWPADPTPRRRSRWRRRRHSHPPGGSPAARTRSPASRPGDPRRRGRAADQLVAQPVPRSPRDLVDHHDRGAHHVERLRAQHGRVRLRQERRVPGHVGDRGPEPAKGCRGPQLLPERPAYDTVYRCLQPGRRRLDVELVGDIVTVLSRDAGEVEAWRAACAAVGRRQLKVPDPGAAR